MLRITSSNETILVSIYCFKFSLIVIYSIIWNTCIVFPICFERRGVFYFKDYIVFIVITIFLCFVTKMICNFIQVKNIISLVWIGIICVFVPNILLIAFTKMNKVYWRFLSEGFEKYLWKK